MRMTLAWIACLALAGCSPMTPAGASRPAASPHALQCARDYLGGIGYRFSADGGGYLEGRREEGQPEPHIRIVSVRMSDGGRQLEAEGRRERAAGFGRTGPGGLAPRPRGADTTGGTLPGLRRNREAPLGPGAAGSDARNVVRRCATWTV